MVSGLREGIHDAFTGVTSSLDGVFDMPSEGARQEGVRGFVKGGLRGIGGAILKPTTGALELLSKASTGTENTLQGRPASS